MTPTSTGYCRLKACRCGSLNIFNFNETLGTTRGKGVVAETPCDAAYMHLPSQEGLL